MKIIRSKIRSISFVCFIIFMTFLSTKNFVYAGVVETSRVQIADSQLDSRKVGEPALLVASGVVLAASAVVAVGAFVIGAMNRYHELANEIGGRRIVDIERSDMIYDSMDFESFDI